MICGERAAALRVGLLPTLPYHAGVSMQAYAAGLIESLARLRGVHAELLTPPFAFRSGVSWARNRWIRYVAYPAWAAAQPADVYHIVDHGNAQLLWRLPQARTVVTCHDLYPLGVAMGRIRFPGAPRRARMLPTALRLLALRRARVVLAVSQHTADECRQYLGIAPGRCRVVYESVSSEFWALGDAAEVTATRARHGIGADDIAVLHVGSNDARKNLSAVCQVLGRLRARTARAVRLLKVGVPLGPNERAILRREGVPEDAVRDLGPVESTELVRLYQAATVLLYPSFYEGFCRPVVEAMATGLPVVAAGRGAILEVAGGAASLHDPRDVEGMATRIADLAENPGLRNAMAEAEREAARRFSADGHGEAVGDAYREVGWS